MIPDILLIGDIFFFIAVVKLVTAVLGCLKRGFIHAFNMSISI